MTTMTRSSLENSNETAFPSAHALFRRLEAARALETPSSTPATAVPVVVFLPSTTTNTTKPHQQRPSSPPPPPLPPREPPNLTTSSRRIASRERDRTANQGCSSTTPTLHRIHTAAAHRCRAFSLRTSCQSQSSPNTNNGNAVQSTPVTANPSHHNLHTHRHRHPHHHSHHHIPKLHHSQQQQQYHVSSTTPPPPVTTTTTPSISTSSSASSSTSSTTSPSDSDTNALPHRPQCQRSLRAASVCLLRGAMRQSDCLTNWVSSLINKTPLLRRQSSFFASSPSTPTTTNNSDKKDTNETHTVIEITNNTDIDSSYYQMDLTCDEDHNNIDNNDSDFTNLPTNAPISSSATIASTSTIPLVDDDHCSISSASSSSIRTLYSQNLDNSSLTIDTTNNNPITSHNIGLNWDLSRSNGDVNGIIDDITATNATTTNDSYPSRESENDMNHGIQISSRKDGLQSCNVLDPDCYSAHVVWSFSEALQLSRSVTAQLRASYRKLKESSTINTSTTTTNAVDIGSNVNTHLYESHYLDSLPEEDDDDGMHSRNGNTMMRLLGEVLSSNNNNNHHNSSLESTPRSRAMISSSAASVAPSTVTTTTIASTTTTNTIADIWGSNIESPGFNGISSNNNNNVDESSRGMNGSLCVGIHGTNHTNNNNVQQSNHNQQSYDRMDMGLDVISDRVGWVDPMEMMLDMCGLTEFAGDSEDRAMKQSVFTIMTMKSARMLTCVSRFSSFQMTGCKARRLLLMLHVNVATQARNIESLGIV